MTQYFLKEFRQKIKFDMTQYFQKEFRQKNTTFGMIFEKSPENCDFEIWLAGLKFHQTFKAIKFLTRIKRYMI